MLTQKISQSLLTEPCGSPESSAMQSLSDGLLLAWPGTLSSRTSRMNIQQPFSHERFRIESASLWVRGGTCANCNRRTPLQHELLNMKLLPCFPRFVCQRKALLVRSGCPSYVFRNRLMIYLSPARWRSNWCTNFWWYEWPCVEKVSSSDRRSSGHIRLSFLPS
jgi:hypothetical protein